MIPRIERYVIASVSDALAATVEGLDFRFWVEGIDFDDSAILSQDNAVLRIIGPTLVRRSGEDWYYFDIHVLVTHLLNHTENAYKLSECTGSIAQILASPIPVKAFGAGEALLGCLDIPDDDEDFLRVVSFGVIEKDTRVKQSAVIVKYLITLDT